MRTFTNIDGTAWQAALLDGSYGAILLVFSPLRGGEIRQQPMQAENLAEAETLLAALDENGLRQSLSVAEHWDPSLTGF